MEQQGFNFERPEESGEVVDTFLAAEEKSQPKIYSISEFNTLVRDLVEGAFPTAWVTGEVSNFSEKGGHYYFSLKDDKSILPAVMFRGSAAKLPFRMENGLELVCHGKPTLYLGWGRYQIIVTYCEPKGMGALQLAFEQLKQKLKEEGLFDEAHKKALPFLPKKIGVVTSGSGAAVRDIIHVLRRRYPNVDILIAPVKVQGEGAAAEVAHAIRLLNLRKDVDVMIVGRGGGSLEDLWAFNEEVTARAIYNSAIPVISAVGHEIDFTIADFVADKRAPTPSAAAEIVVPRKEDLLFRVQELKRQLWKSLKRDFEGKEQAIVGLRQKLKDPTLRFPDLLQRVGDLRHRVHLAWQNGFERHSQRVKQRMKELHHLSPLHVLAKGYAVVQKGKSKQSVKSAKNLQKGEKLHITFFEGDCEALVSK